MFKTLRRGPRMLKDYFETMYRNAHQFRYEDNQGAAALLCSVYLYLVAQFYFCCVAH